MTSLPQVTVPGMVDNFAAKYSALNIPYPGDQVRVYIVKMTITMSPHSSSSPDLIISGTNCCH